MRKVPMANQFKEITRPVEITWKEAKRSDENGNIYTETRRKNDVETVHVLKGIRDWGSGIRACQRQSARTRTVR